MDFSNWLTFCGVAFLTAFTPGPGVLLAISNSVLHGPRHAFISSLGNALGVFLLSASVMAGIGVLLATSATAFMVLKLLGAGYLVFLGIKQWRSGGASFDTRKSAAEPCAKWQLFGQGVSVAITNPKTFLFFSALFPQFLIQEPPLLEQFFVLTTTLAMCIFVAHIFYVLLAHRLKNQFANPQRSMLFNRVTGGLFVAIGLSLLPLRNKTV